MSKKILFFSFFFFGIMSKKILETQQECIDIGVYQDSREKQMYI